MNLDNMMNVGIEKNPAEEAKEPEVRVEFGAELNDLRKRVVNGEEVSREELAAALITLRDTFGKKIEAKKASKKKPTSTKSKTKSKAVSAEKAQSLLDGLI